MSVQENITSALKAMRQHKVRAFLTMLGIIIGISSFILISSVGAGAQELVLSQIKKIGSNLVVILPGASEDDGPPVSLFYINITTLKQKDAQDIERNVDHVVAATSYVRGSETVTRGEKSRSIAYFGVSSNYLQVEDAKIDKGRFFTEEENERLSRVIVIGSGMAEEFFGLSDPVGEELRIGTEKYTVIGVFEKRGSTAFQNQDDLFIVPISTAQKLMIGIRYLAAIRAKVDSSENIPAVVTNVENVLRENHRIKNPDDDDFTVRDSEQALGVLTSVTDALTLFLTIIGGMSLLVGGIGIMNIMFVSVSERTYEIGLRKAIGASNENIMKQFLVEAIVITFIGGLIGVLIGVVISWIIATVAQLLGYEWQFIINAGSVLLAFVISVIIGIIFGIYPAKRAANKEPVEALRYG